MMPWQQTLCRALQENESKCLSRETPSVQYKLIRQRAAALFDAAEMNRKVLRFTGSGPAMKLKEVKRFLSRICRKNSHARLIEANNNEDAPDSHTDTLCLHQNSINSRSEDLHMKTPPVCRRQTRDRSSPQPGLQGLDRDSLCELLELHPDCLSVCSRDSALDSALDSGLDSGLETHLVFGLIQESVRSHLPQPPPEQGTDPQRHLLAVQAVLQEELIRLAPRFNPELMRVLAQSYHRAVFRQMKELLLQTCSFKTCFPLLDWALTEYLSLFPQPELLRHLDLVLYSDWVQEAQDKLFVLLKTEVSSQLGRVLDKDKQLLSCLSEEDYQETYICVIKSIDAAPAVAQKISSELSLKLFLLNLHELLGFIHSYKSHCLEILTKAKSSKPELVTFLKIHKTCKEIKKHVQTKAREDSLRTVSETIVSLLEEIEAFTLKILLEVLTSFTETCFKRYFTFCRLWTSIRLMSELRSFFTVKSWLCLEDHEMLMGRCYRLILSLYSKHLISHRLHRLMKVWNRAVFLCVEEDAELIHEIFTERCPAVERWRLLDDIHELLLDYGIDTKKLIAANIQKESEERRCSELTPPMKPLLQWVGLSRSQTRDVLSVLDQCREPGNASPRPWCMSWF